MIRGAGFKRIPDKKLLRSCTGTPFVFDGVGV